MAQSFSNKIKEFQAALKNMPGTEKNAEALSRIIASVAASQDVLRELGSRGMVSELNEYIDTIEKLMKSVSSIKIPKRPAMHSDSPKKNAQELLEYQRRLEKLNVVFDDYNEKVQKANEKAAMFANFTKHGYDKSEEIKAKIAETRAKLRVSKGNLTYYENKLKLMSAKITDMKLGGEDTAEIEAKYARYESIKGQIKNYIVQLKDELGRLKDIEKDLKKHSEYTKADNELRRKEAERDYREAAAQIEREERQRQRDAARRFKELKTSTQQKAVLEAVGGDFSFNEADSLKSTEAVKKEIAERQRLLTQVKQQEVIAKANLVNSKDENEMLQRKKEYIAAIRQTENVKGAVNEAKERLVQVQKENKELERKKKIHDELRKQRLQDLKITRDAQQAGADIIGGITSGKMSRKDLDFQMRRVNAELSKMPKKFRDSRADIFAKQLAQAGISTRTLNGHLEVTKVKSQNVQSHFSKTIRDMFSMEKLLSRISFVITAKLSYELFDTISRLPKKALNIWKDFESELSKTFALIASSSADAKRRLESDIVSLSIKYGIAAKEISTAMYEIISAQVPLQHASKVMEQSIKLAIAGGSNLTTAAHSLVQIVNAYDMGFENIARVSDVAFQTIKYGQLTMEQYTNNMQKVVSTAAIFGLSIEEISGAIATMTINGIGAEQAFTALNQMLMVIANPTERAKNLMRDLGISLSIKDIQEKGLGFALQELLPLLQMTGDAGEELITYIFKSRTGFKAVASILQNMGEYEENYIRMLDSVGATTDALIERTNTYSFWQNKLTTSWETFLMSFVSGENSGKAVSVLKALTSIVQFLSRDVIVLSTLFKMLFVQGIMVLAKKAIISLNLVDLSVKKIAASLTAFVKTNSIMIIIQSLVLLSAAIGHVVSSARKANLDKDFNLDKLTNSAREASVEVEKLDSNISKLESVKKMIDMYDRLAAKQNKSNEEISRMDKLFSNIKGVLKDAGITITDTGKKIEGLAKYIAEVDNKISEFRTKRMFENVKIMSSESNVSLRELAPKSTWAQTDVYMNGGVPQDLIDMENKYLNASKVISNTIVGGLSKAIDDKDIDKIAGYGLAFEKRADILEAEYKKLQKEHGDKKHYKDVINDAFVTITEIRRLGLGLQQQKWDNISLQIPDFDENKYSTSKDKTEKSYMDKVQGMFNDNIGTIVYSTLDEFKEARKKALDEVEAQIRKDINDPNIVVKDAKESLEQIKLLREMNDKDTFMQLFTESEKAIAFYAELGQNLLELGEVESGRAAMMKAKDVFNSYKKRSSMSDDKLKEYGVTDTEIRTLRENMQNGGAKFLLSWFNAASSFLSDKEYLDAVVDTFEIDKRVTESINSLDYAIKQAEADGQSGKTNALKKIREMVAKSIVDSLSEIISLKENSEFYSEIEKRLKQIIDEEGGVEAFDAALLEMMGSLNARGIVLSDKDIDDIGKLREGLTGDSGFNVKQLLGIKEYKDESAAIFDVAQQAVNQLSQVWSFYWQWEQQQLQKQTEKKLAILKREKDIMLANVNMSEEQKALINEKYAERERILQEEQAKKLAAMKKKQAIYDAMVDFAKGLIGIHTVEYGTKGLLGIPTAALLTGLLTGVFAAQMAIINNQKFAGGGYTGAGYGSPDETGHKPAGIVHAGELVIDKQTLDRNFNPIMSMYEHMKSGGNMGGFLSKYLLGGMPRNSLQTANGRLFAQGGYVGQAGSFGSIQINLNGARVLDPIELNKIVEIGGKKRRRLSV